MSKINKGLIVPVLALIALMVKQYYKITISETMLNEAADVILGIISAIGFFMHPQSKTAKADVETAVKTVAEDVVEAIPTPVYAAGEKPAVSEISSQTKLDSTLPTTTNLNAK